MNAIRFFKQANQVFSVLAVSVLLSVAFAAGARAADVVTTFKDADGWKLQVNGEDYYVKGVVWSYTPRGQNYSYNLWGESDDFVRKVLDYEFGLMKAAGINTIRSFAMIPPEWVTYIFKEYGIRTVINPLMGRYGYSVGGKWVENVDYSEELTRSTLLVDMLEYVKQYKNTPGILMFAFGNESNYGLSWSSFEIENLPEGEQNTAKARYLYSLFNEVLKEGKKLAPHLPFTIVNGDIQYIDLIAELMPDLDVFGTNVYRGSSFTSLWADVDAKLDLPVILFEFGSDAFNARELAEDQGAQAVILRDQWKEMYNKAAGNGEESNSIGGFVFEWRDEWWKYLQTENLDRQDNNASWSNQAYTFDWADGNNNMNEEWFGITALGAPNSDGVHTARPRAAYDVLSAIWHMDPYLCEKSAFNQEIDNFDIEFYAR
jgi:beta-galactosidase